jgi:hypothetical protein
VGGGFFPLDEELGLLPGKLSPSLVESAVRLGTWLPFAPSAQFLAHFTQTTVSPTLVRRLTERVGAAYVDEQTAQVGALEADLPAAPAGPERLQLSVDGAMVPLVHGEWAEAKTLAVGEVGVPPMVPVPDDWEVHTTGLSYFSRLADAETFGRVATVETHRRGVETAETVIGVVDGAAWCQSFLDLHRPDCVRILDFPHAVEHLSAAAQASFGPGTAETSAWLAPQIHTLKTGAPEHVLDALRGLPVEAAAVAESAGPVRDETVSYLDKRREQIRYAEFVALGYPIGSGMVESANKLVVEQRLKGAGMHWARDHVNPLLALRTVACSDRWGEAWPQITTRLRAAPVARWRQRHHRAKPTPPPRPARAPTIIGGRPTKEHPWKKYPLLPGSRPYTDRAKT